jgi:hypothetical protein
MSLVEKLLTIAKGEVGYHEGRSNGHWNNFQRYSPAVPGLEWSQNQAWCCTFVAWLALKAGAEKLYPRTASCQVAVAWFKKAGRFSEYPAVGAQVFFGPGGGSHTGVVVSYDADYIYTIEGNTNDNGSAEGDGVYTRKRERRSAHVYGYGYPKFPEGIVNADPAFKGENPAKHAAPKPVPAPPKPAPRPAPKPVPAKPKPKPYTPPRFPVGIAPGHASPSAAPLQRALKRAGFMNKSVPESDNYGPKTQESVGLFLRKYPQFAEAGKPWDVSIGPKGWAFLFTLAYKK